jgi:hypothetical protein
VSPGHGAQRPSAGRPAGETPPPFFLATGAINSSPSSFETHYHDALNDADDRENREQFDAGIRFMKGILAEDAILKQIYDKYLAAGEHVQDKTGVTLMLRDIPYRWQVDPHLFEIFAQMGELEHVDYIYLPMAIEGFAARSSVQARNKGYCFIHFSVAATAEAFASRISGPPYTTGGKSMSTHPAKFQGLGSNLINLLDIDSKKWRPKHGIAHIRISKGELVCVGLLALRNLLKRRAVRPTATSAAPFSRDSKPRGFLA